MSAADRCEHRRRERGSLQEAGGEEAAPPLQSSFRGWREGVRSAEDPPRRDEI